VCVKVSVVFYEVVYHVHCSISVWRSVILPNGLCGTGSMFARMHWSMDN